MPDNVAKILKYFTGELPPYIDNARDSRRMFIDELSNQNWENLFDFLNKNKVLIISDILKSRGKFSTEWMLVIVRNEKFEIFNWTLKAN